MFGLRRRKKTEVLPYEEWWVAFADAQEAEGMWLQPESKADKQARRGANIKTGALALSAVLLASQVGLLALEQERPLDHWLQDLIGMDDQGNMHSAGQTVDGSVY